MSISKWLDKVAVQQYQIERKARKGNFDPKIKDDTFYVLLDLYEKGYDMVTWIVTDHEAKCELCKFYDSHQTTWKLSEFLGLTRTAEQSNLMYITAAPNKPWVELDDSEKLEVLRTPITAYNYAKRIGYINTPEEVLEELSKDLVMAEYFLDGFLETTETETVPKIIVDRVAYDAPYVERTFRELGGQDNFPSQLKFKGMTEEEVALEDQKNWNDTLLKERVDTSGAKSYTPLYDHSHVGCKCQLMVWKSYEPTDMVYVDASGLK